ncbi:T9SS type B sorting domain-containing protein [Microscilla marina]|uniref:PKD domain protein n=1 Tax=Microscilla marina ATCC 23134 TaxID=313606 RepID=A1ZL28_MICM2|nr:gliding motility-associated C-terminal domain-containing protein [Microscilla marina]EAY28994.1 PKD domain protein [Microscilla marina ATCC 23134]
MGNKLAVAIGTEGICQLFDFDNNTGAVSNPVTIDNLEYAYGVEFSPDGKKLYISRRYHSDVYQYDISNHNQSAIVSSLVILPTFYNIGALQLAPDGKIYCSKYSYSLDVINNPDGKGNAAIYQEDGVSLNGRVGSLGLPTFVQSYFNTIAFTFDKTCKGQATEFTLTDTVDVLEVNWNFGDPASGVIANTSIQRKPTHVYATAGTYFVTLVITYTNGTQKTFERFVVITDSPPKVDLGPDQILCDKSLLLDATDSSAFSYAWSDGSTRPFLVVDTKGTYWVDVTNSCGTTRDSIDINDPSFTLDLGPDRVVCLGDTVSLNVYTPGATYEWQDGSTDSVYVVADEGVYTVRVTKDGCTQTDDIKVSVIKIELPSSNVVLCKDQTLRLDVYQNVQGVNFTYTWRKVTDPSTGATTVVSTDSVYTITQTGEYTVRVAGGGCAATGSINVGINNTPPPTVDLGKDTVICFGTTLKLDATLLGQSATYLWQDGSTNPTYIARNGGLYYVDVTSGGCTTRDAINITIEFPLPLNLGKDSTVLCDPINGLPLVAYNPRATAYLWNDGSTNDSLIVKQPGTYWVTITSSTGCITQDTILIIDQTQPLTPVSLGNDTTLCSGQTLLLDAGNPQANYLWQNGSSDRYLSVTNSGKYWVEVTNGCQTETDTINVTYIQTPVVDFGADKVLCAGEPIKLDAAQPGATYLWQDGSTDSVFVVNTPGKYWVKINRGKCAVTDTIDIDFTIPPVTNLGKDTILCDGQNLFLDVYTPGATYLWQDSTTNPYYEITQSGTYAVQVSIGDCKKTDTVVVSYPDANFNLGDSTIICTSVPYTLDVTNPHPAATYLWQDGSTNPTFTVSAVGWYKVTVSLGRCTSTDSVYIDIANPPQVNLGKDTLVCNGSPLLLDAFNPGATYEWSDGSKNPTLTVTQSGMYWVKTSIGQCSVIDTINVTIFNVDFGFGRNLMVCQNEAVFLDVFVQGATYEWNTPTDRTDLNKYKPFKNVTQPGTYWVTVKLGGCEKTDTITIEHAIPPVINFPTDSLTICQGDSIVLNAFNKLADYMWQDGSTNPTYAARNTGWYKVAVSIGQCVRMDSMYVNVLQKAFSFDQDTLRPCTGSSVLLNAYNVGATYLWDDGSTLPFKVVTQNGWYKVEVSFKACAVRDSVFIEYTSPPSVNLGADQILCNDESLLLNATSAGATYEWQDGSTNPTFTITQSGKYWVAVKKGDCIVSDTINVEYRLVGFSLGQDRVLCEGATEFIDAYQVGATYVWQDGSTKPYYFADKVGTYWVDVTFGTCSVRDSLQILPPVVDFGGAETSVCAGQTLVLDATLPGALGYLWSNGTTDATLSVTNAGTYSVTVRLNNCEATGSIKVSFINPPDASLATRNDTILCTGGSLTLQPKAAIDGITATYLWSDGSTTPTLTITNPGLYWVAVTEGICTARDTVVVNRANCNLYVPNVITPNGDGKNDTFKIPGLDKSGWKLIISNRLGNVIYRRNDYQNDWNGGSAPAGLYFYSLTYKDTGVSYKGWIKIMK